MNYIQIPDWNNLTNKYYHSLSNQKIKIIHPNTIAIVFGSEIQRMQFLSFTFFFARRNSLVHTYCSVHICWTVLKEKERHNCQLIKFEKRFRPVIIHVVFKFALKMLLIFPSFLSLEGREYIVWRLASCQKEYN